MVKVPYSRNTQAFPRRMSYLFREICWILQVTFCVFLMMALVSYSRRDPSWMHAAQVEGHVLNWGGRIGAWVSDILLLLFGLSAYWWVVFFSHRILINYRRIVCHKPVDKKLLYGDSKIVEEALLFVVVLLTCGGIEALHTTWSLPVQLPYAPGGVIGEVVARSVLHALGFTSGSLVLLVLFAISLSLYFRFSWFLVAKKISSLVIFIVTKCRREVKRTCKFNETEEIQVEQGYSEIEKHERVMNLVPTMLQNSEYTKKERNVSLFTNFPDDSILPSLSLLDLPPLMQETIVADTREFTSRLIERKLKDFNIDVSVVAVYPGPVITRYEIEPTVGVKGSQIVNLTKDLARSLSLASIRVVEIIPGKNFMALEVPNQHRQTVYLAEILGSIVYADIPSMLTIGLGKDICGKPVCADLVKMPHLLVAGTTGSGKSVGIHAMILSFLYKATVEQVRMILIDPKMLEMSVYDGIAHLLCPVVTDMQQASNALNWAVVEMERRYKLMSNLGVRNLASYNNKINEVTKRKEKILNPLSNMLDNSESFVPLPRIVVVIDELADLMMVVGKKVEELIVRIAQKARAAGIHLILATQRPSVDVITGLIKANIPTRIAFQVSSKIDSRTILDQLGAESLLGMGDMLYLPPGVGLPIRVHGAFVSDDEVHRVVAKLKEQGRPQYIEGILGSGLVDKDDACFTRNTGIGEVSRESDPLYDRAVAVVIKNRCASTSLVQHHLCIGYNRAARLLAEMERLGLVSPPMSSNGNREILELSHEAD